MRSSELKYNKREYWLGRVREQKKFPGTILEYCEVQGIKYSTFNNWKKRLKTEAASNGIDQISYDGSSGKVSGSMALSSSYKGSRFSRVEVVPSQERRALPEAKWLAELITHLQRGAL